MTRDRIEFYEVRVGEGLIATVESSHAPARGDKVNIRGSTYLVTARAYKLDRADNSVCCVVVMDLEQ